MPLQTVLARPAPGLRSAQAGMGQDHQGPQRGVGGHVARLLRYATGIHRVLRAADKQPVVAGSHGAATLSTNNVFAPKEKVSADPGEDRHSVRSSAASIIDRAAPRP
jgi:hypothetical protein